MARARLGTKKAKQSITTWGSRAADYNGGGGWNELALHAESETKAPQDLAKSVGNDAGIISTPIVHQKKNRVRFHSGGREVEGILAQI